MANTFAKIFTALGLSDPSSDTYDDYYDSEETNADDYSTLYQNNHPPTHAGQTFFENYRANPDQGLAINPETPDTSRNNTVVFGKAAEVVILEPTVFEDVPFAMQALRSQKLVVLNLFKMETEAAQRAVDFLAGGTFIVDGDLEKVGETIFIFTPHHIKIKHEQSQGQSQPAQPYPVQQTSTYHPARDQFSGLQAASYSPIAQRAS